MIKWIGRLLHPPVKTSIPHAKLEYCFSDSLGVKYYKFPESMSIPIERLGKLHDFMMWMSSAITSKELDGLLDEADKALTEGLLYKKNAAKIGFIHEEIRNRKKMIIHTELLYNFLAVQVIREDELPEYFNNSTHMEKVERFKEETKNGNTYGFFLNIGLKRLNALYSMSEQEWNKYWAESIQQQKENDLAIQVIQSEKESLINNTPLTNK